MQHFKLFLFLVVVSSTSILPAAASSERSVSKTTLMQSLDEMDKKGFDGWGGCRMFPSADFNDTIATPWAEAEFLQQLKESVDRAITDADLALINKKLAYIKYVVRKENEEVEVIRDGKPVKAEVRPGYIYERVIPAIIAAQDLLPTARDYMIQFGNPQTMQEYFAELDRLGLYAICIDFNLSQDPK